MMKRIPMNRITQSCSLAVLLFAVVVAPQKLGQAAEPSLQLQPGDHILVHVGYAIQKVSEQDAADSWALFDEVLAEI